MVFYAQLGIEQFNKIGFYYPWCTTNLTVKDLNLMPLTQLPLQNTCTFYLVLTDCSIQWLQPFFHNCFHSNLHKAETFLLSYRTCISTSSLSRKCKNRLLLQASQWLLYMSVCTSAPQLRKSVHCTENISHMLLC